MEPDRVCKRGKKVSMFKQTFSVFCNKTISLVVHKPPCCWEQNIGERDSGMSVTLWKWMHWTGHNTNRNDIASRLPFRRVVHTNLLLVQTVFFFSLHCVRSALDIKFALFLSLCATSRALYLFVQIIQKSSAPFYERGNYLVRCHFYLF